MSSLSVSASGAAADAIGDGTCRPSSSDRVASRLFAQDATLWGPDAESEAAIRLAWVGPATRPRGPSSARSRRCATSFVEQGVDHVVLCGMGGSSLAPEVICAHRRRAARRARLLRPRLRPPRPRRRPRATPSSSSRASPAPRSRPTRQRRAFEQAFTDAGIDPARASSSSPTRAARSTRSPAQAGYRVVNADPDVGGRYSALTAFGLVPSGLAGVDIEALLDEAEAVADLLAADDDANPGLRLGAAMGGTEPLRDKLVLVDDGSGIVGFADWAEQLIAESTGKGGTGVLPVVVGRRATPRSPAPRADVTVVAPRAPPTATSAAGRRRRAREVTRRRRARRPAAALGGPPPRSPAGCSASTRSTSPTSRAPRRPPASCSTRAPAPTPTPPFTDGAVEVRALGGDWLGGATTVPRRGRRAARRSSTRARLRRGDGLPRPAGRRRPRGRAATPGRAAPAVRRRSAGARASCTRPGSTTRAARRRRLPPGHHGTRGRTSPSRAATSPSATSSPPRPAATPRCSPTTAARCSGCT